MAGTKPNLLSSDDYIFVTSNSKIQKIDPSAGSTLSEWDSVQESNSFSHTLQIVPSHFGMFWRKEPDIQIDDTVLNLWKNDQLAEAEASLTSLRIHPSVVSYIAMSVALVGKGENLKHEGYRLCDIAFQHAHSSHVSFLPLVKAIIIFMAGDHDDAISRPDDLIATVPLNSVCYVVQAYMQLLLANSYIANNAALGQASLVSLIYGWKFDDLSIVIQQRFCEALQAEGHTKRAGDALLEMVNTFGEEVCLNEERTEGVSSVFMLNFDEDVNWQDQMPKLEVSIDSQSFMTLLKEWARATSARGSWKDALTAAVGLKMINRESDASGCFSQMVDELAGQECPDRAEAEWVISKPENLGDIAMNAGWLDDTIFRYSTPLSLKQVAL
ncbi:hypothetical protein JVU11DRAFT_3162 [Chiua virens]|nr:hypothetical protein JVU11DRAFT_3162 [Chiua virens]